MNISSKLSFKEVLNKCNDVVDFIGDDQKIVLVITPWEINYNNEEASRKVVYELNRKGYQPKPEYVISTQFLSFPNDSLGHSSEDYTTWFGGGHYYKNYQEAYKDYKENNREFWFTDKERFNA
tara:strand:+ start:7907 stop:8275 length:369 start_codon:yes stop_codon:yes gene_type:complete